jgi:hypothetical protein
MFVAFATGIKGIKGVWYAKLNTTSPPAPLLKWLCKIMD